MQLPKQKHSDSAAAGMTAAAAEIFVAAASHTPREGHSWGLWTPTELRMPCYQASATLGLFVVGNPHRESHRANNSSLPREISIYSSVKSRLQLRAQSKKMQKRGWEKPLLTLGLLLVALLLPLSARHATRFSSVAEVALPLFRIYLNHRVFPTFRGVRGSGVNRNRAVVNVGACVRVVRLLSSRFRALVFGRLVRRRGLAALRGLRRLKMLALVARRLVAALLPVPSFALPTLIVVSPVLPLPAVISDPGIRMGRSAGFLSGRPLLGRRRIPPQLISVRPLSLMRVLCLGVGRLRV